MTILLTGGTGNTAKALARQLKTAGIPFIAASRKAKLFDVDLRDAPIAKLDFQDPTTYDNPFQHPSVASSPVQAIYIMTPPGHSDFASIIAFVDHAVKERGISRFVLLGGQSAGIDAPYPFSKVWKHLFELQVDYAVLQASWFNENLFDVDYLQGIQKDGKLYSASADGRMGFIAVEDIAAAGFALLTSKAELNGEAFLIIGPELVSNDETADRMSKVLSRKIEHVRLSEDDRYRQLLSLGLNEKSAKFHAHLEVLISKGVCEAGFPSDNIKKLTGREPQNLTAWIEKHKQYFT